MFEHKTFDAILQDMLDRVSEDVDKREGAIIYDALAPTAMELAEAYSNMDLLLKRTFADSADGDDLERRVGEHGVYRKRASKAIRKGVFTGSDSNPFEIEIGSRFRLNDIVYNTIEVIELGTYQMEAETAGIEGNQDFGDLLPVEPANNLGSAILAEVLVLGEEEESDGSLYAKYLEHINESSFGGNRADYHRKILDIQGVGGVRLFRAPEGGGSVRAVIIDSSFNVPSRDLVEFVQEKIDPSLYTGNGFGLAPIGHIVTIEAVESVEVDFEATLALSGVTLGQVEPLVVAVVADYLNEIRKEWKKGLTLIARITHLESRLLMIDGVQDITGTTLNGYAANLTLSNDIPVEGNVILHD